MKLSSSSKGLRGIYEKLLSFSETPKAFYVYCLIAFAESSFFPIPPDLFMIPLILAKRSAAFTVALWGTVSSVIGGVAGYGIGLFLFNSLGQWLIDMYHLENAFRQFQIGYAQWGFWIILLKGLTPIPYKLIAISSGFAHFNFLSFFIASLISRGFRFFMVATLLWWMGPEAKVFIEKHLAWMLAAFFALLIGGFVLIKFI